MVIDSSVIDLHYIVGPYVFEIEERCREVLERDCQVEASASKSEEQQQRAGQLSKQARARVSFSGTEAHLELYFMSVPEGSDDYAELFISNGYTMAKYIFSEEMRDAINQSDSQERLMELVGPQLKEQISNMLQSMVGGA